MEKKLIALAIAAALTAPALAYAEATVYGQVNPAIDMVNDGNTPSTSANLLSSYGSRVGVMGSKSLDGGMSIVWQLEAGVNVDDGKTTAGQFFDRESNIGLTSDSMGTVMAGLQASPYKAVSRRLDMFGDTVADTRGNGTLPQILGNDHGGANFDASPANAISYKTPSMGGFTLVAATVFGAEIPQPALAKKGSAIGLAAMYDQGPIFAAVAIDNTKYGSAGTGQLGAGGAYAVNDESNALKVGGSYTMDAISVNAAFEQLTHKVAAGDFKNTTLYLAGKFSLSSTDAVKVAFATRGETKTPAATLTDGKTQISVGYDHGMSKNTSVYALFSKVTQKATGAADPSVISLGLKHAF